ncbi:MAG: hypothetical protein LBH17_00065 [Oscillospiraceae bacterium]|nr:hypothetical protein [Oscillospiraceae bacterium]
MAFFSKQKDKIYKALIDAMHGALLGYARLKIADKQAAGVNRRNFFDFMSQFAAFDALILQGGKSGEARRPTEPHNKPKGAMPNECVKSKHSNPLNPRIRSPFVPTHPRVR